MDYQECLDYLFSRLPMYQNEGKSAYKKDLTNTIKLLDFIGNPQHQLKCIHVAGTNGKGSVSSMLAATLTQAGYKTGLYTSPHLLDFTERIRIDGIQIPQKNVIEFVAKTKGIINDIAPSFFELTVAMAFDYFKSEKIDVAVIEVGLGGRLDSTNVIEPDLSVITSIGWDHMDLLGNSLEAIAYEKSGIIKKDTPVVYSRFIPFEAIEVIIQKAKSETAPHYPSELAPASLSAALMLKGTYQRHNIDTFYTAIEVLKRLGYLITWEAAHTALANVTKLTGLKGRWEKLQDNPTVICDTGHNAEAMPFLMEQLEADYKDLPKFFIWGMVADKDRTRILSLLPKNAHYYLVKPGVARGYNAQQLQEEMLQMGFNALAFEHFSEAIAHAKKEALTHGGIVFIGGSTFLVADALLTYTPA